jgi:hypothetical protein
MKDVLPPAVSKWQFIEEKARAVLESFAFRELRSASTLDRAYVAHARWEHEPVTRWYRLDRGEQPRLEGAVFGPRPASADAELVAMTVGMLADLGVPGGRRVLSLAADEETRALLSSLSIPLEPGPAAESLSFELRSGAATLAHGARNDDLVASQGGPPVPLLLLSVDLAAIVEAIDDPAETFEPPLTAFFACDGPAARAWALVAAHKLRLDGIRAEIGHDEAPLDEQRARAAALDARLGIIVHEDDLRSGHILVEDHGTDRHELIALAELESTIRQRVD